jgi:hypothetical protein
MGTSPLQKAAFDVWSKASAGLEKASCGTPDITPGQGMLPERKLVAAASSPPGIGSKA